MDQKYLSEIKAREQAAAPGPWEQISNDAHGRSIFHGFGSRKITKIGETFLFSDADFIAHARTDIPALLAEVERLTDLARQNYCKFVRQQEENATLEKQINLMAKYIVELGNVDMNLCDDIPNEFHLKYQPKNDGNYPNEPCIQCVQEYFRQQAEQPTDEVTHGEAEK